MFVIIFFNFMIHLLLLLLMYCYCYPHHLAASLLVPAPNIKTLESRAPSLYVTVIFVIVLDVIAILIVIDVIVILTILLVPTPYLKSPLPSPHWLLSMLQYLKPPLSLFSTYLLSSS